MTRQDWTQPVLTGVVAGVIGFVSSSAIVLAGLHAVGATRAQEASGLLVLCIAMGVLGIILCWRTRMPASVAWSTPGAAVLVAIGHVHGGYRAALGAFVLAGVLTVIAGIVPMFERAIESIPSPIANALLAGVLVPICLAPARSVVATPALTAPVIVVWLVLSRVIPRLAVPTALLAAIVGLVLDHRLGTGALRHAAPTLTATTPSVDLGTLVSVGVSLFLVTMASQNLAGIAVLSLHGYRPRLRPILTSTGAASVAVAPFGGHAVNLASVTAGLMAGPDAGERPERRWLAGVACGVTYIVVLAPLAGLMTQFIASSPALLVEAVAGLALLGSFGAALTSALSDPGRREAAIMTFVVTASGITAAGLSAAVWGVLAGLVVLAAERLRVPPGRHAHISPVVDEADQRPEQPPGPARDSRDGDQPMGGRGARA